MPASTRRVGRSPLEFAIGQQQSLAAAHKAWSRTARRGVLHAAIALVLACGVAPPAMAAAGEHYFDSDGVRIRYTTDGNEAGEPVILVHGYTASGATNWRVPGMIERLAPHYRVITIDNRGHGGSDKPRRVDQYGVHMVEDVVRLMDHLQLDSAHVVGYSMGGMITLKLASLHPQRVRSGVIGGMGWLHAGASPLDEDSSTDASAAADDAADAELEPLVACRRAFARMGLTRAELEAVRTPLVVVVGTDDSLRERMVTPLEEARPDIPIVLVEGANHLSCVFHPKLRDAVSAFLAEQTGRAADEGE